jgi:2-polyprenyl-3-methyl-5-hydroxy-6-metoxy-1,4-benzoquinol methylase
MRIRTKAAGALLRWLRVTTSSAQLLVADRVSATALDAERECPVCGDGSIGARYRFGDFEVLRCSACETAWRSNMYTREEIVAMYRDEPHEEHPFFGYAIDARSLRRVPRFVRFEHALELLETRCGVGRLLDVGCGAGTFLSIAADRGWDVHGVEPCEPLCEAAEQAVGEGRVTNALFEEAPGFGEGFDAVTMWDVLEHVLDPSDFVERAIALLRPGGLLVICTPDEESLLARTGRALYRMSAGRYSYPARALHPRYHTYFFSGTSLERLAGRLGLQVVESYSQAAFAKHSPLATRAHRAVIGAIERVGALRDSRYERVIFAQPQPHWRKAT